MRGVEGGAVVLWGERHGANDKPKGSSRLAKITGANRVRQEKTWPVHGIPLDRGERASYSRIWMDNR